MARPQYIFGVIVHLGLGEGRMINSLMQPFVLLTIICLSSLTQTPMENVGFHKPDKELKLWICHIVIPVPVIILVAVLSNIIGRKFSFKVLCVLTTISAFFESFPWLMNAVNVMQSIITGGVFATTFLAISEYCTPKHRLAYLIANTVARETVGQSTSYIVGKWLPVFKVGMGLMCLGSVYTWPETPVWLLVKGRHEEARSALLWLRKEGDSARSELQYMERVPRPLPRAMLFWDTLLPFVAVSVSQLSYCHQYVVTHLIDHTMPFYVIVIQKFTIVFVLSLIVFSSYRTKRNVIYFILSLISIASYYLIGFWLVFYHEENETVINVLLCFCCILLYCGIYVTMNAIFIEFVPLEYNTQISCICAVIPKMSSLALRHVYLAVNLESVSLNTFFVIPFALSLCGAIIVYKFSPVTHNKNLLEIRESSDLAQHIPRSDATQQNPISIQLAPCERDGSW